MHSTCEAREQADPLSGSLVDVVASMLNFGLSWKGSAPQPSSRESLCLLAFRLRGTQTRTRSDRQWTQQLASAPWVMLPWPRLLLQTQQHLPVLCSTSATYARFKPTHRIIWVRRCWQHLQAFVITKLLGEAAPDQHYSAAHLPIYFLHS